MNDTLSRKAYKDVAATGPTVLSVCSGYGGFELAFELLGLRPRVLAYVEREGYAASILLERMEQQRLCPAPVWCGNVEDLDTAPFVGVDIFCGGIPCQPFSAAGDKLGTDDARWIWPDIARIIADIRPRIVILENVTNFVRHGLPHVLADLAALGFDAEWGCLSAADVGAPHARDRFWLLAYAHNDGLREERWQSEHNGDARHDTDRRHGEAVGDATGGRLPGWVRGGQTVAEVEHTGGDVAHAEGARCEGFSDGQPTTQHGWPPGRGDHDAWAKWIGAGGPQPVLRRSADGPPRGLADALHLGGNGLVPQAAAEAIRQLVMRAGAA